MSLRECWESVRLSLFLFPSFTEILVSLLPATPKEERPGMVLLVHRPPLGVPNRQRVVSTSSPSSGLVLALRFRAVTSSYYSFSAISLRVFRAVFPPLSVPFAVLTATLWREPRVSARLGDVIPAPCPVTGGFHEETALGPRSQWTLQRGGGSLGARVLPSFPPANNPFVKVGTVELGLTITPP